jgi:hypothetical protein
MTIQPNILVAEYMLPVIGVHWMYEANQIHKFTGRNCVILFLENGKVLLNEFLMNGRWCPVTSKNVPIQIHYIQSIFIH